MIQSNIIGQKIKKLRESNKITQKKLGEILGYSEAHISYIESGQRSISNEDLKTIADLFNVSSSYLLVSPSVSNNHFRSSKTEDGQEILDNKMWNDFIDFAKKQK